MTVKFHRVAAASLVALASAIAAQPALAQTAQAADDNSLGDIVVTARKVAETSQSLPITVAAFSGKELSNKVILAAQDLMAITPGLTVSNSTTGGVPIFAIRGTATELGIDGGVALYFNDVPLISSVGIMNSAFDVSTIEVLKGPQGTQFGTNTTGGTISFRTNLPTDKFEGYVKAGYGNFNRREFEGVLNLPINDKVGLRLAGNYVKRDGYVKNIGAGNGIPDRLQDENHYSLRGTLSIRTDGVENDIIADYYNRDEAPFAYVPLKFVPSQLGLSPGLLGGKLGTYDTVFAGPDASGVRRDVYGKAALYGIQDKLNVELSDSISLRNVLGYRHDHTITSEEDSGTTIVTVGVLKDTKASQWTDDLTLRYTGLEGKLRASLGGYYSYMRQTIGINANVLQGIFGFFGFPNNVINTNNIENKQLRSKAVYFNAEYDITDTLGVSGGFRYNWDSVNSAVQAGSAQGVSPLGVLPRQVADFTPNPLLPCAASNLVGYDNTNLVSCTASRGASFKAPSWNFVVTNKFSSKVLGYVKASHGYLAGGTNFTLRDPGRTFFQPETNTMFEAGVKADWELAGRPIRTNVAIYRGRISNKQVFANANYTGGGTGFGVVNAAKETVYGIDIDARYSPAPGLTFDLGYNYVKAKWNSFIYPALGSGPGAIPAADLSGLPPAQVPKHQLNVAASYEWPISEDTGKVTTTISGYYTSEITQANRLGAFDAANGGQYNTLPSYFLANASINWEDVMRSPVSVQLWIRNIGNKHNLTATSVQLATFGYITGIYGAPRTFGASATVKF